MILQNLTRTTLSGAKAAALACPITDSGASQQQGRRWLLTGRIGFSIAGQPRENCASDRLLRGHTEMFCPPKRIISTFDYDRDHR
jgi:hypothetical protein